jgi:hypothetical protein
MKFLQSMLILLALGGLVACGIRYPSTNVEIQDARPTIGFSGAPAGSQVFVDGIAMGPADKFDGRKAALLVEPGTHVVQVRNDGRVLLSETVFLGEGATRIFVVN